MSAPEGPAPEPSSHHPNLRVHARRPRHHRHHRPARDEERVHRRHVGRDRRDVPRPQLLRRARGRAHRRAAATSAPAPISAAAAAAVERRARARRAASSTGCGCSATSVLAVHGCPVPVIAKVDGVAVGAGFGLALGRRHHRGARTAPASRPSSPSAGLSLDFGTSWLLRQRIGVHKAKELAFTAEMVSGARGARAGPGQRGRARRRARRRGRRARRRPSPPDRRIALSMTKRELDHAGSSSLAQALETEALAQNVNVAHRRHRRGAHRVHGAAPAGLQGPVDRRMIASGRSRDVHDVVAAAIPDRDMIVWGDDRRTYGEVAERSPRARRVSSPSRGFGRTASEPTSQRWECGPGPRRRARCTTGPSTSRPILGCWKARVVPCNVNYHYTAGEVAELLQRIGARGVIYDRAPRRQARRDRADDLDLLIEVDDAAVAPRLPARVDYDDRRWSRRGPAHASPTPSPDDLYIACTGGTTGRPKAVLWRQADIFVAGMGGSRRPRRRRAPRAARVGRRRRLVPDARR